jgi:hypothetical protein
MQRGAFYALYGCNLVQQIFGQVPKPAFLGNKKAGVFTPAFVDNDADRYSFLQRRYAVERFTPCSKACSPLLSFPCIPVANNIFTHQNR